MVNIKQILGYIIDKLGALCALLMVLMLANVFTDVVMRYALNDVSIGMQEMEWHLFAAMFLLGIGYTLKENGHVRVDVFYDKFSEKAQALINLFGCVLFIVPFCLLILYFGIDFVVESYQQGEGSGDPGGLPYRWLIKSIIPLSASFLVLSGVYVILEQLEKLSILRKGVEL